MIYDLITGRLVGNQTTGSFTTLAVWLGIFLELVTKVGMKEEMQLTRVEARDRDEYQTLFTFRLNNSLIKQVFNGVMLYYFEVMTFLSRYRE